MKFSGRVLIAHRHPVMRAAIREVLQRSGFEVVGETDDTASTVAAASAEQPDVCLVHSALVDGFAGIVHEIRRQTPAVAVVVMSQAPDQFALVAAVAAGATGYLVLDLPVEQLPRAVAAVLRGELAIPRGMIPQLLEQLPVPARTLVPKPRDPRLTNREQEVLDMLRAGMSTSQIAAQMFVGSATVRTHVSAILSKLHLPGRTALVDLRSEEAARVVDPS